jgi:hypothetical protein
LHTKGSLKHLSNSKSALDMPFFLKWVSECSKQIHKVFSYVMARTS